MNDQRVHAFAELARKYCSWAEGPPTEPPSEEAVTALRLLLHLYQSALDLPEGEGSEQNIESNTQQEWQATYRRFSSLPVDVYYEIFDPLESPADEPVGATLGDDLADIHRDLLRGLLLYERGDLAGAAWEWAFHFRAHWGRHAMGAVNALHAWWVENYFRELSSESEAAANGGPTPRSS